MDTVDVCKGGLVTGFPGFRLLPFQVVECFFQHQVVVGCCQSFTCFYNVPSAHSLAQWTCLIRTTVTCVWVWGRGHFWHPTNAVVHKRPNLRLLFVAEASDFTRDVLRCRCS